MCIRDRPYRSTEFLAAAPEASAPLGVRYIWLRFGAGKSGDFAEVAGMAALLEPFPRVRLPVLECQLDVTGEGDVVEIKEAWLVTLSEPR